jgi:hypothetical protein
LVPSEPRVAALGFDVCELINTRLSLFVRTGTGMPMLLMLLRCSYTWCTGVEFRGFGVDADFGGCSSWLLGVFRNILEMLFDLLLFVVAFFGGLVVGAVC